MAERASLRSRRRALAFVHTLGAGTDAANPWLRTPMLVVGAIVALLLALRIFSAVRPAPKRRVRPAPAQLGPAGLR